MAYPNLSEITTVADEYYEVWQRLLAAAPKLRPVLGPHLADALGWKVDGEMAPLEATLGVYELGDTVFCGPVNGERAIMTVRKPRPVALDSLRYIKILQRRPSRPEDKLGADSLDFILAHGLPEVDALTKAIGEVAATAEADHNDAHSWISIVYDGHEFKLQDHSVWEVCVREARALLEQ